MKDLFARFCAGFFGWSIALIFLGFFAHACWWLIYLGWSMADFFSNVSK